MTLTLQELVLRRRLERTDITGPAQVGQHHAFVLEDHAIVSYIGEDGMAYQLFLHRDEPNDEWVAHPQILRIGTNFVELRPIPRSLGIDDKIRRSIDAAIAAKTEKAGKRKSSKK